MSVPEPDGQDRNGFVFTQTVAASGDGRVYAVQHGDLYRYIYRNTPPYRVEPFPFPDPGVVPAGLARVPSRLLTARHQIVPFVGRPELEQLQAWRDSTSASLSVRLVHAEGGQGKTRLASEFAARSANSGWAVALARHRSEVASAGGGDEHLLVRPPGLVLIVDYAERWPLEDLITLVRQHRDAARDRLRILLLGRPAGTWWQGLAHQFAKLGIFDSAAIRMQALPEGPTARAEMYTAARDRFVEIFAIADPASVRGPADFGDPVFALTLTVHMRALVDVDAAVRGQAAPAGSGQAELSSYLLDREHDYWRSSHDGGHGPVQAAEETMGRAVYVATLTRSLPSADATRALVRANVVTEEACGALIRDHARCYPPEDPVLFLEPLYPDRLGEDFLALTVPGHEDQFGYHATDHWTVTAPALLLEPAAHEPSPASYTRQAMTTLIEAARRWPHITQCHLYPLLTAHPQLALQAGGTALATLANLPGIDREVLEAIGAHVPGRRHVDLDIGIAALAQRLADYQLRTSNDPAERARILGMLATRLAYAGLYDRALNATQDAVELSRHLAAGQPEAFLPSLAAALNNQSQQLRDLGRREAALAAIEEAVVIQRQLTADRPGTFLLDLGSTLNNQSTVLSEMGRLDDALAAVDEAVSTLRQLAAKRPDHLPDLAKSLNNQSIRLRELGRREDALVAIGEGIAIYRQLASEQPDMFLPDLAAMLDSLFSSLRALGQREAASAAVEESVTIRRQLAARRPDTFLPDLSRSLNNQSIALGDLGRPEDALATLGEVVTIDRRLAAGRPTAFLPGLAATLNNQSNCLSELSRFEDALAAIAEAVSIHRRLTGEQPDAFLPDLAVTLHTQAVVLNRLGRIKDALTALDEAITIRRKLADAYPDAFLPLLTGSLNNRAVLLQNLKRHKEALATIGEVITIQRRLDAAHTDVFLPNLVLSLSNLSITLMALRRPKEALIPVGEAVDISRRLARTQPDAFLPELARTLNNQSLALAQLGRHEEALTIMNEAVSIYQQLANAHPDAFLSSLKNSLKYQSRIHPRAGRRRWLRPRTPHAPS